MKQTILLALWALCLCTTLHAQNAQQKRWVLDNQRIDFTNPNGQPTIVPGGLPATAGYPIGGTPGALNGIHDPQGNLLFYIDPSYSVINKYGNQMPTTATTTGTLTGPLENAEICVIPVPGSTCKYYIVYLRYDFPSGSCDAMSNTNYCTVDLSLNNNQGGLSSSTELENCLHTNGTLAVGPLNASGTKRYLYKVGGAGKYYVQKFDVTATGISAPTIIYSSPTNIGIRSAEADLSLDGTKLAFANEGAGGSANDVIVVHLNPLTGLATGSPTIYDVSSFSDDFTGVEFSPNGNNLFVGQEDRGIYQIALGSSQISLIGGTLDYGNSHLELAYHPSGLGSGLNSIYAVGGVVNPNGTYNLGRITLPNSASPAFQTNVITGIKPRQLAWYSEAFQLPDQIDGFDYDAPFNNVEPACCAALTTFTQNTYTVPTTAPTNDIWTPGSNPFNNTTGTVKIATELRIRSGKSVTIKGMRFEFGPRVDDGINPTIETNVIIEPGARLILDNSTLTSIGCQGLWGGIDVAGINTPATPVSQYATNSTGLKKQGHLIIRNNSLIENAHEAVRLQLGNNIATTGGIVQANNSTFRNNWRCAEFIRFQNTTTFGTPANNLSYFKDCIFETTIPTLNNGQIPYYFVTMWAVDGVGLQGNIFQNTSNQSDRLKRGNGIKSIDAKYKVQGYCTVATPYGTVCSANNLIRNRFQRLTYGIDASASNVMNTITVSKNEFDNNWRGVLLRGMDFATVTENNFNVGATTTAGASYGLYTDNCSGYKIEENNFFTTHSGDIGSYTWNSGFLPNRIYRNTFNNLYIGSAADENNGQFVIHGTGLEYRCNSYNCIGAGISVLPDATIAQNQGYCDPGTSDPAGNTFIQQNNSFDIFKGFSVTPNAFYYYFHSPAIPGPLFPDPVSVGISRTNISCNPYNGSTDCKSTIYPDPIVLKGKKQLLYNDLTQQKNLIDNGNTALLVANLATLSPGQAKNAMMAVAPYTSDVALLAYLSKNPPSGHLNQVIAANSPVTTTVWSKIEQMNVPNGIKNQLTTLQTGISARAEVEGSIAYYEKEIWLMTDELIRYYLNDTIVTDPMDSVIVLLKEQNRQTMKCQQLAAEIKAGKLADADATVAAIAIASGGQITDNYCKLLSILLELEKASLSCLNMSSPDENTVRDIAADDTKRGCAQAQALLNIAFNESFPETVEKTQFPTTALREVVNTDLEMHQEMMPTELQNTSENSPISTLPDQTYSLTTYPNPFDKILTVNTKIPDNVQQAEFMLYDVLGKELKRIRLAKGASVVEINGEELQEGILYYVLILDDKIVENGKVIYMRKVSDK